MQLRQQRVVEMVSVGSEGDRKPGPIRGVRAQFCKAWIERWLAASKSNADGSISIEFI
jgi:hypothetical protein